MARILIIDDDQQVRSVMREILERAGYETAEAENGKVALEQLEKAAADLIITDIIMPEKEGIETIKDLKEKNCDAKIIAISGGGSLDPRVYLHFAEKLGAKRTLMKPFSREELLGAVKELLM